MLPNMKKILFIDRDGTLIEESPDEQIDAFEKLKFYPKAISNLAKIAKEMDFKLVMVTNQDGLGTEVYPEDKFNTIHNFIINTFANEGVVFEEQFIDRTFAKDNLPTRKPGLGLLTNLINEGFNKDESYVIGDRFNDVLLAKNLGIKALWLRNNDNLGANEGMDLQNIEDSVALQSSDWDKIYQFLKSKDRKVEISRVTNETDIEIELNLNGSGKSEISTGLNFFNHMLEQIAKHGLIDLNIKAVGDLHIDEHHTIEDTGLALGEAFRKGLGDKLGIERYGFCLPMDDCLASVALDFGGRNWIVWEAEFKRERIGDVPTEMFFHFFKSFSDAAKCNLNIKAEGENEHHKIEAIFKAFAKAIKMAIKQDPDKMFLPSTKGLL